MRRLFRVLLLVAVMAVSVGITRAQTQTPTGEPAFGSFSGSPDTTDLANLNTQIIVPILHKAGRGLNFTYDLSYDTSIWYPLGSVGSQMWMPVQNFGWRAQTEVTTGYISYQTGQIKCYDTPPGFYWDTTYLNFQYHDSFGAVHSFNLPTLASCSNFQHTAKINTYDGSGYTISATDGPSAFIIAPTGQILNPPLQVGTGSAGVIDANGNEISVSGSTFTDTLGVTALTVSGTNPMKFNYTAPSGVTASYSVSYVTYTVATAFGISGITDYPKTSIALVDKITLPDTTFYQFKYEATPGTCTPLSGTVSCVTGRLKSVAFPTLGTQAASFGTITYTYTGANNGIFSDGSAAGLTRVTPDGTWTYARTLGTTAPASTTTVTNPVGDQAKIQFQGIYETQRQTYAGTISAGTLLQTVNSCYNSSASPCTGTAILLPIIRRTVVVAYGSVECEQDYHYDPNYGMLTEQDDFDYGTSIPATPIRKELITYATLGNGIVSAPQTVTIEEGSGTAPIKSQTTYTYDQGTPVATSSPQHLAVSGYRGNATTIAYLVQGASSLTRTATYFDTGNVQTSTDLNGAQTTFTYGACGNAFATTIVEPLSLSRSATWNCNGGVQLTAKNENGAVTTTAYNDPDFWRPKTVTDPTSAATTYTYGQVTSLGQLYIESKTPVSSSTIDIVQIVDGLGRPIEKQQRQASGSSTFDSILGGYDTSGRLANTTQPYPGTLGENCCMAPNNTTTFDTLGRLTKSTDAGGGTITYTYNKNDVLIVTTPAPAGENAKSRQLEYDSLGRIKSVCEITAVAGSGSCSQNVAAQGFLTKYTYDAAGNVLTVAQNTQVGGTTQNRSYTYDLMSRLTSETNPENSGTVYTYETDPGCGVSSGDMVKKSDAVGNQVCYAYDALHRLTSVLYYGPYAANTASKFYVYDAATVNGNVLINAKGRLAEAYTSSSPTGSPKLTDVGLNHSGRGEITDQWESTPHSGGYYYTAKAYWANGVVSQIAHNIVGLPTSFLYGVDGEGRINTTTASSGQNPVTGVTYNASSQPTAVTYGSSSSDTDVFGYDPNTGRMTQYQFQRKQPGFRRYSNVEQQRFAAEAYYFGCLQPGGQPDLQLYPR